MHSGFVTASKSVAARLKEHGLRVVLAESCTAGLVAATLARVPGISDCLCGSAVTYRNDTKHRWLKVPQRLLDSPGPVSEVVARKMALGVLRATPEADLAAAVTGHLGPDAPREQDGLIYVATACRKSSRGRTTVAVQRKQLAAGTRLARQREAAACVLGALLVTLENW